MSIGSLGIVGGLAGSQVSGAKGAGVERAVQETAERSREVDSGKKAEKSAGIGQAEEEQEASDRDADGHLSWDSPNGGNQGGQDHRPLGTDHSKQNAPSEVAKDPLGELGRELDLSG